MKPNNLQDKILGIYDHEASTYDQKIGYGIQSSEEMLAWVQDLFSEIHVKPGSKVLECGIGTGAFAKLWLDQGCELTGIDISPNMLDKIKQNFTDITIRKKISLFCSPAEDSNLFPPETFDLIVCRHFVCHLQDPIKVFLNWMKWLKNDGRVVIVEGMWARSQWWSDDELVDTLPLSCINTRATISCLLSIAGFKIEKNFWMMRVNQQLDTSKHSKRYTIVAYKSA